MLVDMGPADASTADGRSFQRLPAQLPRRRRRASTSPLPPAAGRRQAPGAQARDRLPRPGALAAQRLRRLHALRPDGPAGARRPARSTPPTAPRPSTPRSGVNVTVEIERQPRRSRGLIATPETGLRMSALELPLLDAEPAAERHPPRRPPRRPGPHLRHGAEPRGADRAPRLLAARAPTRRCSRATVALVGAGPVGVFAAASAEPSRTAAEHIALLARHGVHGVDLGVTIDTVDYADAGRRPPREHRRPARRPALRRQPDPPGRDAAPPRRGERRPARHRPRPRPGRGADRGQRRRLGALGGDDRRRLVLRGAALRRLLRHRPPRPRHPGGDRPLRRRHRRPEPDRRQPPRPPASSPAPRRASASASASSRTAPSSPPTPAPASRPPAATASSSSRSTRRRSCCRATASSPTASA